MYKAGRRWNAPPGDDRQMGDEIPEAAGWDNLDRMLAQKVVTEHPRGEWVYFATYRWPEANPEKPGERVTSVTRPADLEMLLRGGFVVRVDSHDIDDPDPPKRKRGRPKGSKNKNRLTA
jgi:hypothetical protein